MHIVYILTSNPKAAKFPNKSRQVNLFISELAISVASLVMKKIITIIIIIAFAVNNAGQGYTLTLLRDQQGAGILLTYVPKNSTIVLKKGTICLKN